MKRTKKHRFLKFLLTITAVLFLTIGIGALYMFTNYETTLDLSLLDNTMTDATTRLYYYNEGLERSYSEASLTEFSETLHGEKKYLFRSFDQIPKYLVDAFVAIEDKRFYEHNGVDWYRTAAATANYVLHFEDRFGASTITQQLIKNATGKSEVSVHRKLQEILWALDVERQWSKQEILEKYHLVN